jgi:hypothetical protein
MRDRIAGKGYQLRVLTAHLDDGTRIRMISAGEGGLREYLVDEQSSQGPGNLLAAATGDADSGDFAFRKLSREGLKLALERMKRVTLDPGVCLGEKRLVRSQECGLDGHRTDIDSEEEVFLHGPFLYAINSRFACYGSEEQQSISPPRLKRSKVSLTNSHRLAGNHL